VEGEGQSSSVLLRPVPGSPVAAMAVWIRSGRVRFRHVSRATPRSARPARAAWARVDSGLCEGTRHIYMQAGVSLVPTFFLVLLVPSAGQGESSSPLPQTWARASRLGIM